MREEVLVVRPSAVKRKAGYDLSNIDQAVFNVGGKCPAPELTYVKRSSLVAGLRRDPKSQQEDLSIAPSSEIDNYGRFSREGKGKQLMRGSVSSTIHHAQTKESPLLGDLWLQWGGPKRSRSSRGPNHQSKPCNLVDETKTVRLEVVKNSSVATNSNAVAVEGNAKSDNTAARKRDHPCFLSAIAAEHAHLQEDCKREKHVRSSDSAKGKRGTPQEIRQQANLPNHCITRSSPGKRLAAPDQAVHSAVIEDGKVLVMPKFVIGLSRKELEEDFLILKGTKLSKRPKRRPRAAEKALLSITPGIWLSDVSLSRYTVREKKCVKGKLRGLKAMESMETDSE